MNEARLLAEMKEFSRQLDKLREQAKAAAPPELIEKLNEMLSAGVPRDSIRLVASDSLGMEATLLAEAIDVRPLFSKWLGNEAVYLVDMRNQPEMPR